MSSEPFFLVDEELLELESILTEVQFRIDNPNFEKNQLILRSFVKACIKTQIKPKPVPMPIQPRTPKIEKEIKKVKPKEIPNKKRVFPITIPGGNNLKQFKTKTKYQKQIEEPKDKVYLILDRVTNKPLAVADIDDRYIVREPRVTEEQIQILRLVIDKRPESPKEAWQLLKQLAPNLKEDELTNVKYYIINSLFALGRLEPLLHDKEISGIQCDGVGQYLMIRRDGKLLKTNIIFKDKEDLDSYLQKLAQKFDKTLDESNPILDIVNRNHRFQITLGLHGASSKFVIKKVE
jgi:hypothetical protein